MNDINLAGIPVNFLLSAQTFSQSRTSFPVSFSDPSARPRNGPRVPGSSGPSIFWVVSPAHIGLLVARCPLLAALLQPVISFLLLKQRQELCLYW